MQTSLWLIGASLLAAGSAGGADCGSCTSGYCSDAGAAREGMLVTRSATITFALAEDELRLIVRHRGSSAQTVLDLPYSARKMPLERGEREASRPCDEPTG
jgi:hypothetical protein